MSAKAEGELIGGLLAGTELFKNLGPMERAACAAKFHARRFKKGQVLFGRGDPGSHVFLMAEGQVRLAIATAEGRELSFQIAVAGDLIGEIAVLDGGPRSADATALTAVTTYVLSRS